MKSFKIGLQDIYSELCMLITESNTPILREYIPQKADEILANIVTGLDNFHIDLELATNYILTPFPHSLPDLCNHAFCDLIYTMSLEPLDDDIIIDDEDGVISQMIHVCICHIVKSVLSKMELDKQTHVYGIDSIYFIYPTKKRDNVVTCHYEIDTSDLKSIHKLLRIHNE